MSKAYSILIVSFASFTLSTEIIWMFDFIVNSPEKSGSLSPNTFVNLEPTNFISAMFKFDKGGL